ncbi:hypothetical protein [Paenibacillus sp. Z6-24]
MTMWITCRKTNGGKWKNIDEMKPQRSEKGHIRAVTPGSYDAIRLVYSAMNVEGPPYRTIEISTIHMFSGHPYIAVLAAEPANTNNAALRRDPVPDAEKYIVRYGPTKVSLDEITNRSVCCGGMIRFSIQINT